MITQQSQEVNPQIEKAPSLSAYKQFWKKNGQYFKGSTSPNKLLKYNYKQSIEKMYGKAMKYKTSTSKLQKEQKEAECIRISTEQKQGNASGKGEAYKRLARRSLAKSDLSHFEAEKNSFYSSQILFQESCHNFRQRSASFTKNMTQSEEKDRKAQTFGRFSRKVSHSVQKQNNKRNPYTNSQYLYVKNQSKDEQTKKRIINQNKFNFGKNIERSCKIISFVLINPLEKYDKAERMHRTNSTLPECPVDDQEEQSLFRFKLESKQVPISHRKKSIYYKHAKRLQNSKQQAIPQKRILPQADFSPTPWESPLKNCDLFYLKVEQL